MTHWRWVPLDAVLAAHADQLRRHGGLPGVRDQGALESALARPQNVAVYGEPDLAALTASYALGLARNHAFSDGNKRTAWVVAKLFAEENGGRLKVAQDDIVAFMLALAAGELSEDEAAAWFRARLG